MISTHTAVRYIVPLREGGSLPAILDTEDGGQFVTKFRGAGQGAKALVAELVVGLTGQALGLPVPELGLIELDESFGRTEKDPEIQDILKGSVGLNVGLRYLPGAFNYDPVAVPDIDPLLAADIVWLDALTTNIDRTPRNTNMLWWENALWLIDHGAALYFHHNWPSVTPERARVPFVPIRDHVLLPFAGSIADADERMSARLHNGVMRDILAGVPDDLLMDAPEGTTPAFPTADENRDAYCRYFEQRLTGPRPFVEEAEQARLTRLNEQPEEKRYRR